MISIPISQDKYKNNLSFLYSFDVKRLPENTNRILLFLLDMGKKVPVLLFSYQSIADYVGCSVMTVRRALSKLRSLGILQWKQRFNSSSIYYINPRVFIRDYYDKLRQSLHSFFKYFISIRELLSRSHVQEHSEHLSKIKGINSMEYIDTMEVRAGENDPFGDRATTISEKKRILDRTERNTYLDHIEKDIPLTIHGKIKLLQYPSPCLKHATSIMKIALNKYDPFIYLLSVCENFCKENNLEVNFALYRIEKASLGISSTDNDFIDMKRFNELKIARERGRVVSTARPPQQQCKKEYHLPAPQARVLSEEEFVKRDKELLAIEPTNIFQKILLNGLKRKYGLGECLPV